MKITRATGENIVNLFKSPKKIKNRSEHAKWHEVSE